jgi:hypothetical protein
VIVFAHEDIPRGGVAVLTPEEAAAALDQAARADEESPG